MYASYGFWAKRPRSCDNIVLFLFCYQTVPVDAHPATATSSYMRERRSRGYPAPLPPLNQLALNHGAHNNHLGAHLSNHNHGSHHSSNSQQANSQTAGNNGQAGHQGGSQANQVDREREMASRNHVTAMAAYQQLLQQQPPPDLSGLNNSNQSNNDNTTNAGTCNHNGQ